MKVYLVEVAVLLAVTSFIFCTGDTESSTASGESESTEPKQPVFCKWKLRGRVVTVAMTITKDPYFRLCVGASLEDQKKIFNCTQDEINNSQEVQEALKNYTNILCGDFGTFFTSICNNTNRDLFQMTTEQEDTLFNLVLDCETKLGVTLPPTSTPPAC